MEELVAFREGVIAEYLAARGQDFRLKTGSECKLEATVYSWTGSAWTTHPSATLGPQETHYFKLARHVFVPGIALPGGPQQGPIDLHLPWDVLVLRPLANSAVFYLDNLSGKQIQLQAYHSPNGFSFQNPLLLWNQYVIPAGIQGFPIFWEWKTAPEFHLELWIPDW